MQKSVSNLTDFIRILGNSWINDYKIHTDVTEHETGKCNAMSFSLLFFVCTKLVEKLFNPHSERYQLLLKLKLNAISVCEIKHYLGKTKETKNMLTNKWSFIWIVTTSSELDPSDQITDSDSVQNHPVTCYRLFRLQHLDCFIRC